MAKFYSDKTKKEWDDHKKEVDKVRLKKQDEARKRRLKARWE